ncbi:MAG: flavodoxin family protein [Christensenellaceae bacterium]|nr:flavodoxin family protein [Christensenellaceae bacterium]
MKVLLVNGSPHENGCTRFALDLIAHELSAAGIESEIFWAGISPLRGCTGCAACKKLGTGRCVYTDDLVNAFIAKAEEADAFVFGSPVHYAAASGTITSLLDRAFYAGAKAFTHKPGAAVVCCRRAGATAAFEQLSKYFTISQMPIVSSQYWNMLHGAVPADCEKDAEGMQTMRTLGKNMAWLLKCIEAGKAAGVALPKAEAPLRTNFVR